MKIIKISKLVIPVLSCVFFLCVCNTAIAIENKPLEQGIQFFQKGDNEKALIFLNQAVNELPQSVEAFYYLGLASSKQGDYTKAVAAFKVAVRMAPSLSEVNLALGVNYYRLDLYDLAKKYLTEELKINANNSSALYFLGMVSAKNNDHQKAIGYFRRAALIDKDFKQLASYNVALSHISVNNNVLAKQSLQKTIDLAPDSELAKNARSIIEQLDDDSELADTYQGTESKSWSVAMKTGFEFDDNVTVSIIDNTTGIDDLAATFDFSGAYKLIQYDGFELDAEYNLYQSVYKELSEFDFQSHTLFLSASKEIGD
ncbi:MAG: tetratricopeptide repeat protein, partial [Methylomarinum sp.]|nr:tetratricopeptide repeat protein [Methylomarinum sp.]